MPCGRPLSDREKQAVIVMRRKGVKQKDIAYAQRLGLATVKKILREDRKKGVDR